MGFVVLCRELNNGVASDGDALEVLQAAKVAGGAGDGAPPTDTWRDLAVFDHPDLLDAEKAKKLRVVCIRWQLLDGVGGVIGGTGASQSKSPKRTAVVPALLADASPHVTRALSVKSQATNLLFGHIPEGTRVWTRQARVAQGLNGDEADSSSGDTVVIAQEGGSNDWSVKRCEISVLRRGKSSASQAKKSQGKGTPSPLFGNPPGAAIRIALEIAPEDDADGDGVYDDWLGGETRAALLKGSTAPDPSAFGPDDLPITHGLDSLSTDKAAPPDPNAKTTRVSFHYLYHRGKLRKTEMTSSITCPLCLKDAENFQQLCTHLDASHGRFKFAFFPDGDAAVPHAQNLGRPPHTQRTWPDGSVEDSAYGTGGVGGISGNASDTSQPVEIVRVTGSGPAIHVMCREEDENAMEQVDQDEWEWFHKHGGWYAGSEARRKRLADKQRAEHADADPDAIDLTVKCSNAQEFRVKQGSEKSRKEMLPTYAVKEFVFASRRYPLESAARHAMREAHELAVRRTKLARQAEEDAILKARHRAKRVEAQTNRRRRERAEQLAKDEEQLILQSTEHQRQQLLLMQLSKHREMAIAHAAGGRSLGGGGAGRSTQQSGAAHAFAEQLRHAGLSGMTHLGDFGKYPGFALGSLPGLGGIAGGGIGGIGGGVGQLPGTSLPQLQSAPGGVGFIPNLGYTDEMLAQMRLRELEANERVLRLEIERISAQHAGKGLPGLGGGLGGQAPHRGGAHSGVIGIPIGNFGGFCGGLGSGSGDGSAASRGDGRGDKRKAPVGADASSNASKKPKAVGSVDEIIATINQKLAAKATEVMASVEGDDLGGGSDAQGAPGGSVSENTSDGPYVKTKPGPKAGAKKKREEEMAREVANKSKAGPSSAGDPKQAYTVATDLGVGPPGTAYHAKTAAPMAGVGKDNVGPKNDSDDDDDALAAAREDYRKLSDFQDIQSEEKIFMHEWNTFVQQFAPVGDLELPAALQAFAHHRGELMSKSKTFNRLFALHLLNAFEFGVVPATTVDTCLLIVDAFMKGAGTGGSIPSVGAVVGIPGMK